MDGIFAAIALGSNLGDRRANIGAAVAQVRAVRETVVLAVSSLLENPAVGGPVNSPPFLNGAATLRTRLGPRELLAGLLEIEKKLGRDRREKWGPRTIDLDLLLYGDAVIDSASLVLPHPRMHERRFVLQPLAEIAPGVMHPVLRRTIAELAASLES